MRQTAFYHPVSGESGVFGQNGEITSTLFGEDRTSTGSPDGTLEVFMTSRIFERRDVRSRLRGMAVEDGIFHTGGRARPVVPCDSEESRDRSLPRTSGTASRASKFLHS